MKKKDLTYSITSYVTMGLSIILGILFIVQVIRIYDADSLPMYSRELVGKYLGQILPCIILFVLSVIFIGVYATVRGISSRQNVKITSHEKYDNLARLFKKEDIDGNPLLKKERNIRLASFIINIVIAAGSLAMCFCYLFIGKHIDTTENPTPQIISALVHFSPWVGITLIYTLINVYVTDASYRRSFEILKQIDAEKNKKEYVAPKYEKYLLWGLRIFFIVLGIVFVIIGALDGEAEDVLNKAANICTECVGLG